MAEILVLTAGYLDDRQNEPLDDEMRVITQELQAEGHTLRYLLSADEYDEGLGLADASVQAWLEGKVDDMSPAFDPATDWLLPIGDGRLTLLLYGKLRDDHGTDLKVAEASDWSVAGAIDRS